MSNISSIISGHNKNFLNPNVTQYGCNCRLREDCPLQNHSLKPNIINKADAHCEANKNYKFYFGVSQTPFQERFQNYNRKLNQEQSIKSTKLAEYIWSLKDAETPYTINWSIVAKLKGNTKTSYCPFCLTEQYHLIE